MNTLMYMLSLKLRAASIGCGYLSCGERRRRASGPRSTGAVLFSLQVAGIRHAMICACVPRLGAARVGSYRIQGLAGPGRLPSCKPPQREQPAGCICRTPVAKRAPASPGSPPKIPLAKKRPHSTGDDPIRVTQTRRRKPDRV